MNYIVLFSIFLDLSNALPVVQQDIQIFPRSSWKALPPKSVEAMDIPVPFVVIHYSYIPGACYNMKECTKSMRWMQQFHQEANNWTDIGYNFGIGSDGLIYSGRGWTTTGAHAPGFNDRSIGIVIIGDWRYESPPKKQMKSIHQLIGYGVNNSYIDVNHYIIGHRQVSATDCPGERLFREMKSWEHFCMDPFNCNKNTTEEELKDRVLNATVMPEHA